MHCHHKLEEYLDENVEVVGLPELPKKVPLFKSTRGRSGKLTGSIVVGGPCTGGGIIPGETRQESADAARSAKTARQSRPRVSLLVGTFELDRSRMTIMPS